MPSFRNWQISGPRPRRDQLQSAADRAKWGTLRDEVQDLRHSATHNVGFWRTAVRSHRRMSGNIRQGRTSGRPETAFGFHFQFPLGAEGTHRGHLGEMDQGVQLF